MQTVTGYYGGDQKKRMRENMCRSWRECLLERIVRRDGAVRVR